MSLNLNSGTLNTLIGATTPLSISTAGVVTVANTTASSSTTTGALIVSGGLGVAGTISATTASFTTLSGPHSGLSGLLSDDHTQYALLAGRAGGQILTAGTASGNNLTLRSTTNVTKGSIIIDESTASTSTITGALTIAGGLGVAGTIFGGTLNVTGISTLGATNSVTVSAAGAVNIPTTLAVSGITSLGATNTITVSAAGLLNIPGLTASQAVFTDASKNLVSIAVTGSGNVVLATSPTLVTPVLGVASGTSLNLSGALTVNGLSTLGATNSVTVSAAGVVTIPGLTASQAVFTDASKNLVSITVTGSGSVVLATSPTLVTPVLGVASGTSLNLTSTNASTSATTGTITLVGGIGINNSTDATSSTNGGSFTTAGGLSVAKKLVAGTSVNITTADALNISKLFISGTANSVSAGPHYHAIVTTYPVFQNLNFNHDNVALMFDMFYDGAFKTSSTFNGYQIYKITNELQFLYSTTTGSNTAATRVIGMKMGNNGLITLGSSTSATISSAGLLTIANTTASTSTTSGALTVAGGLGVSGQTWIGGNIYLNGDDRALVVDALTERRLGIVKKSGGGPFFAIGSAHSFDFRTSSATTIDTVAATTYTSRMTISAAGVVNIPGLTASQAVFTDSSKNLVSVAVSGSGNVVLASSPTISTPLLRATSTIQTGGTIASFQDVLGTTRLTVVDETISTSLPTGIMSSTGLGLGIYSTGTGPIDFYTTASNTLRMRINNNGDIELGTTTGATVSAAGILVVNNTTDATSATSASLRSLGGLASSGAVWAGGIVNTDNYFFIRSVTNFAPPTFTTSRSIGSKFILYPQFANGTSADYAIGIESNAIWYGVPTTAGSHKFYHGITNTMTLSNTTLTMSGALTVTGISTLGNTTGLTVSAAGVLSVNNATDSTSSTTGSAIITGGMGIAKKLYVGTSEFIGGGDTLGISRLALHGTSSSISTGPHFHAIVDNDGRPAFQALTFNHNNICLGFDIYYDGTNFLRSASTNTGFQIYKLNDVLQFNYGTQGTSGTTVTTSTAMSIGSSGSITIASVLTLQNTLVTSSYIQVNGTTGSTSITYAYYGYNGGVNTGVTTDSPADVSIRCTGRVIASEFNATSDIRIKTDIQELDYTDTYKLLLCKPKKYQYIDKLKHGNNNHYGVIAQEVKEFSPELIAKDKDYIPNIFKIAVYVDTNKLSIEDELKVGDKLKVYCSKDITEGSKKQEEVLCKVIQVDGNVYTVDTSKLTKYIFVYGTEVEDMLSVDYIQFIPLLIKGYQEKHNVIDTMQNDINDLRQIIQLQQEQIINLLDKN